MISADRGRPPAASQILERDVALFDVLDTEPMRREHCGSWPRVRRPRLAWRTEKADEAVEPSAPSAGGEA
jgi:hypothetical protein